MDRRKFLTSAIVATGSLGLASYAGISASKEKRVLSEQQNWQSFLPEGFSADLSLVPIDLDQSEWKERLGKAAYKVLREEDTARPGSSALNDEKRKGVYLCRGCDLPLFTSQMKFESGTGWPSFYTHIPNHLKTKTDFKLIWPRTEYHCARCGGHQGHVFEDGPRPTGQRWCNNGVALKFIPTSGV